MYNKFFCLMFFTAFLNSCGKNNNTSTETVSTNEKLEIISQPYCDSKTCPNELLVVKNRINNEGMCLIFFNNNELILPKHCYPNDKIEIIQANSGIKIYFDKIEEYYKDSSFKKITLTSTIKNQPSIDSSSVASLFSFNKDGTNILNTKASTPEENSIWNFSIPDLENTFKIKDNSIHYDNGWILIENNLPIGYSHLNWKNDSISELKNYSKHDFYQLYKFQIATKQYLITSNEKKERAEIFAIEKILEEVKSFNTPTKFNLTYSNLELKAVSYQNSSTFVFKLKNKFNQSQSCLITYLFSSILKKFIVHNCLQGGL